MCGITLICLSYGSIEALNYFYYMAVVCHAIFLPRVSLGYLGGLLSYAIFFFWNKLSPNQLWGLN